MDDIYIQFGSLLRDLRSTAGITQEQLADRVGMTRTTVTNIEKGMQSVSLRQLYELADALAVEPASLLPRIDDGSAPCVMKSLVTEPNVKLVMRMMGRNQDASNRGKGPSAARAGGRRKGSG